MYSAGIPRIDVKQAYNAKTKILKLTVTQTQKLDKGVPEAFILPINVEIKTAKGDKTEKLDINKRAQEFSIKSDTPPTKLTLDPEFRVPLKIVKIGSLVAGK